ncbi:MAG: hypothetical protein ACTIJN_07805, partial [Microbacterium gubbeenense]
AMTGTYSLADGIGMLGDGARDAGSGTAQLADGATALSDGAGELADGIGQLGDGATELGDGLGTAVEQLPSFEGDEAADLASVVRAPVGTDDDGLALFGDGAIPLLAAIVLWFGSLATFLAFRPVTSRALTSRRSSLALAARGFLPGGLVGLVQGVLMAGVVVWIGDYSASQSWTLVGVSAVAGIAFAAIHQALAAVLGGFGRWLAAIAGALAIAVSIVSTTPGFLTDLASLLPTAPAMTALLGATTSAGISGSLVALAVWAVLAFVATLIATTTRRTATPAAALA